MIDLKSVLDQILNPFLDQVLGAIDTVYGIPWVAPFVVFPFLLLWARYHHYRAVARTRPFLKAAAARVAVLEDVLGQDTDPTVERDAFSRSYDRVSAALCEPADGAQGLVQAWREFHETIIDETASPVRNTTRPNPYFERIAPKQTQLVFWSNSFVGIGLVLTFLGLVVALNRAAHGMTGSIAESQIALTGLLTIAGAKFFTSIAGLVASIYLRFIENYLTKKVNLATTRICSLLERGLLYVPPQLLAAQQLEVLREQRDELKTFNTDLALQIGDRVGAQFQAAISPVTTSLSMLNDSMTSMGQGLREGLGQGAAQAVSAAAGGELRALGQTLEALRGQLDGLSGTVGQSGADAAQQIRAAGTDFAQAATDIRSAFDHLAGQVGGMGDKFAEQGENAARLQTETLDRMLAGLEQSQARAAGALEEAVTALQSAGLRAAEEIQTEVNEAMATSVAEAKQTFAGVLDESGEALRSAAGGITSAIGGAAVQIERASGAFERSGEGAQGAAQAMTLAISAAKDVARTLGEAASGFATASAPVAQAARAIEDSIARITKDVQSGREAEIEALRQMTVLSEGVHETQAAAESAWREYRARFDQVDKSLETVLVRLTETFGESLSEFRRFAHDIDGQMGAAVSKLGNSLTTIQDYAEALDEYVQENRRPDLEAAQ